MHFHSSAQSHHHTLEFVASLKLRCHRRSVIYTVVFLCVFCHRHHSVFIKKFVTKNTLEEKILSISKNRLSSSAAGPAGIADDDDDDAPARGRSRATTQEKLKSDELQVRDCADSLEAAGHFVD